ncbi:cytochrome ubiquinol oxidase subunit I, partial [Lentibacillus sp.]|uniref:cytochrome ubiquinol oxidase subunit I n=1 Tax=Lentibacillus sp. TaxID=1925746 RepID=UPI002B4B6490
AVFITTVNAFMNTPQGFETENGAFAAVNPIAAMLNPATPTKVFHVLTSAYLTCAAVLAAITAFMILKKKATDYHKKALKLTMTLTLIFAVLTIIAGDSSAKFLAAHQPEKLAAAEWHFETEEGADLILFGWLNDAHEAIGEIRIPNFLSFLAHADFNAEVTGLEETPEKFWPPLWVHYMFDLMVVIGFFLPGVALLYLVLSKLKNRNEHNRGILSLIMLSGPLAFLAIEFGWIYAEEGRQPWIIRGYMSVEEAATSSPYVGLMFFLFLALYVVLGTLCIVTLRKLFRNNPAEEELEKHYPTVEKGDES